MEIEDGIYRDELKKLTHISSNIGNRAVPSIPVYDPDYDTSGLPGWAEQEDWLVYVIRDGKVVPFIAEPVVSLYFGKKGESEDDILMPFFNFYYQHASWPDVMSLLSRIITDVRHLSTSMMKLASAQYMSNLSTLDTEPFIKTEIEYIFSVCRSIYDLAQFVIANTWDHIELVDGGKNSLPSNSFRSMVAKVNNPDGKENIMQKYGLTPSIANFYAEEVEMFEKIRNFRDDVIHNGKTLETIHVGENGYSVRTNTEPYSKFTECWEDSQINENGLAPLWPFVATVVGHTISMLNRCRDAVVQDIQWPPEIAPEYKVLVRGQYINYLRSLDELLEEDEWGEELVQIVSNSITCPR
ncbi:hypothetical protein [Haloferax sp. Atlit-6N]|uniref:hypothetical protein n=1 Tax=Haloferax sp. Atlit-6N TaxID=2077205 RepID=UPI0011C06BC0|nr:hypothetical protein [Haloferax sp. Atlit-6N]